MCSTVSAQLNISMCVVPCKSESVQFAFYFCLFIYFCLSLQEYRNVSGNIYCVYQRVCFWSWQWSASCSGTSVSSFEDFWSFIKLFLLPDEFSVFYIPVRSCMCAVNCTCVFSVYYQCLLGKSCRSGGMCLSPSRWCDGVKDCSHGEDESQCCKTLKSMPQHSTHTYCICLYAAHQWTVWWLNTVALFSLLHSSPPRDQLHAGKFLIWQPDVDAGVCWKLGQQLWESCVWAHRLQEVMIVFFTVVHVLKSTECRLTAV